MADLINPGYLHGVSTVVNNVTVREAIEVELIGYLLGNQRFKVADQRCKLLPVQLHTDFLGILHD